MLEIFNVIRNCIGQVWKLASEFIEDGSTYMEVESYKTNCGHKRKEINMDQVARVPLRKGDTIRSIVEAPRIPKSTLFHSLPPYPTR